MAEEKGDVALDLSTQRTGDGYERTDAGRFHDVGHGVWWIAHDAACSVGYRGTREISVLSHVKSLEIKGRNGPVDRDVMI
jgi:hypothetical protein